MADAFLLDWLEKAGPELALPDTFVFEVPQVYRGAARGADPADLLEIAGVVGAVAGNSPATNRVHFLPRMWKGQVPKDVHNKRVEAALSSAELSNIETRLVTQRHNTLDAVGLGLFFLGRLSGPAGGNKYRK